MCWLLASAYHQSLPGLTLHNVIVQMRKEMEAGQWRGMDKEKAAAEQAAAQGSIKVAPKPYMSAQYKEDSMRTTGMSPQLS